MTRGQGQGNDAAWQAGPAAPLPPKPEPTDLGSSSALRSIGSAEAGVEAVTIRPELTTLQGLLGSDGDYLRVLLWLRDQLADFSENNDISKFHRKLQSKSRVEQNVEKAIELLEQEFQGPRRKLDGYSFLLMFVIFNTTVYWPLFLAMLSANQRNMTGYRETASARL